MQRFSYKHIQSVFVYSNENNQMTSIRGLNKF